MHGVIGPELRAQETNLIRQIKQVHQDSRSTYGSPGYIEAAELGVSVGENRVAKNDEAGIKGRWATLLYRPT